VAVDRNTPPYRWEAFRHWLNLGVLAAGSFLGVVHDPMWFVAVGGIQAATLWVVPDVPPFRKSVDEKYRQQRLLDERAYYLDQLFGLAEPPGPKKGFLARLFFEGPPVDLDSRIVERHSKECRDYLEMREIIKKLDELRNIRGVRLHENDINRLEVVVNGYLRLLISCEPLEQAVAGLDRRRLERDVADIEQQLPKADATVRPALVERLRLARTQLERHPKLEATLHLFRTRAEASVQQLRQIHGQVLADPGVDMTTVLDDMMEKQELLTDPLGQLAADQMVREVLTGATAPAGVDKLRAKAGQTSNAGQSAGQSASARTRR
jgi:hypothetical protein